MHSQIQSKLDCESKYNSSRIPPNPSSTSVNSSQTQELDLTRTVSGTCWILRVSYSLLRGSRYV